MAERDYRIVGFTGTRQGMTGAQHSRIFNTMRHNIKLRAEFVPSFRLYTCELLHHGACSGADRHMAQIGRIYRQVMWPSNTEQAQWAMNFAYPGDLVHTVNPPLERNHSIVDSVEVLVAAPGGMYEELRSGTWATIRYASKIGRQTWIVWPDGTWRFYEYGWTP